MRATYGMRLRGFSHGTFPKDGFIEVIEDQSLIPTDLKTKYYDFLVYDRELSDDEIKAWELDFLWIEREDQK